MTDNLTEEEINFDQETVSQAMTDVVNMLQNHLLKPLPPYYRLRYFPTENGAIDIYLENFDKDLVLDNHGVEHVGQYLELLRDKIYTPEHGAPLMIDFHTVDDPNDSERVLGHFAFVFDEFPENFAGERVSSLGILQDLKRYPRSEDATPSWIKSLYTFIP